MPTAHFKQSGTGAPKDYKNCWGKKTTTLGYLTGSRPLNVSRQIWSVPQVNRYIFCNRAVKFLKIESDYR